jgi:hypothetical protein
MRDQVIKAYPLDQYVRDLGKRVDVKGDKVMAQCPIHADKNPSMGILMDKGTWKCFAGCGGGTVIDLHMQLNGLSFKGALNDLAEKAGIERKDRRETYTYADQYGHELMRVDRIEQGEKKRFAQYHVKDGQKVNGIKGVTRTLYRLEKWHGKDSVALCEGEKCVHALESAGFDATTNAGGSNGWLDAYALSFAGKQVEIWPDNDGPGEKWLEAVLASLEGKVESLRVLRVPAPYDDIADLIDAKGVEDALDVIIEIQGKTDWISKGVKLDLLSSAEAYALYKRGVKESSKNAVDLGKWLPSFRQYARPLVGGDMVVVMADTGVGKTGILSNIGYSQRPLPGIMFEIELNPQQMAERFMARDMQIGASDIERQTKRGVEYDVSGWDHMHICPRTMITVDQMQEIIERSELKIGRHPAFVLVDYIGLVSGGSGKRYERMSTIAEGLKRLGRATNTVMIIATQVRRDNERIEVGLHDCKDSGSIENSAQLVLGAWRPERDTMTIKVLKQTKKAGQPTIYCNYDGDKQMITERTDYEGYGNEV